jgi:hypothetical protein
MLQRKPRYGDREFRRFLRDYQWRALFKGKDMTTAEFNERQKALWKPAAASKYSN